LAQAGEPWPFQNTVAHHDGQVAAMFGVSGFGRSFEKPRD